MRFFRIYYGGIMTSLYLRIKKQTEKLKISDKELGNLLGLKKSPMTDWKNEKSCPTIEQLIKMCDIFSVSADYLLFGNRTSHSASSNNELQNDYEESEWLNLYNQLSPEEKKQCLRFIKGYIEIGKNK